MGLSPIWKELNGQERGIEQTKELLDFIFSLGD